MKLRRLYAKIDGMTPEQREKLLYFIIPLYAAECGYPETIAEAIEADSRYTYEDLTFISQFMDELKTIPGY